MTNQSLKYLRSLMQADILVLLKNRRAMLISVLVPLYLMLITNSNKKVTKLGTHQFILMISITTGMLSLAIMSYALAVARDRERGVFQRLRVTPAPAWVIMVSRLVVQLLASLAVALAVLIIGSQVYHLSLGVSEYLEAMLVVIVESTLFLAIGQALVGLIKSSAVVNSVGSLLYVALLLTGLLGLSGQLGSSFQTFAKWTPVGAVISVFETALHQAKWNGHVTLSLLACLGYILVCSYVGVRWFKWDAQT